MISPAQIRAARALLNWSQANLVEAAHLTPAALSRLENGQTKGRAKTLERLEDIFSRAGVEFLSGNGVRMKQKSVNIIEYNQVDAVARMQDDIFMTMLNADSKTMYLIGVDERKFVGSSLPHLKKQAERLKKNGIRQHILLQEQDRFFVMPPDIANYRWISPELFGLIPFMIYGDKVAIIFWGPPVQVIVMESTALAQTYRKQFSAMWKMAKSVPFTAKEIREICRDNMDGKI